MLLEAFGQRAGFSILDLTTGECCFGCADLIIDVIILYPYVKLNVLTSVTVYDAIRCDAVWYVKEAQRKHPHVERGRMSRWHSARWLQTHATRSRVARGYSSTIHKMQT